MFNTNQFALKKISAPKKKDEFGFSAFIIHQTPGEKKERKFEFSKSGLEVAGINTDAEELPYVIFFNGSDQEDQAYHGRLFLGVKETPTEEEMPFYVRVRKNGSFASKPWHEYLNENFAWINTEEDNVTLEIIPMFSNTGIPVFELRLPTTSNEEARPDVDTQAQLVEDDNWMN